MKKLLITALIFGASVSMANAQTLIAKNDVKPNPQENITEEPTTEAAFADRLFGDVNGYRTKLLNAGVDIEVDYTGDFWHNAKGGLDTGSSYLYNVNAQFHLDGEKLYGIKGNKIDIYFLADDGGRPNEKYVGSLQGVDNIEVSDDILKLYEAKMEQNFFDDKLSIAFGLTDLNSEFYVSEAAGNFIRPEFGIGTEMASTGEAGPSIFPNSALATRVRVKPSENTYVQAAVFDAKALSDNHIHGTDARFNRRDGVLMVAEGGYIGNEDFDKLAFGAWKYSKEVDDIYALDENGNPKQSDNYGFYLLANQQVYKKDEKQLNGFFDVGVNEGDVIQTSFGVRTGIQAVGFLPRESAEFGLAASMARNSDKFMQLNNDASAAVDRTEYGVELYYRDEIYQGITLQPEVQYIVNPGTDPNVKDAVLFGIRAIVNF